MDNHRALVGLQALSLLMDGEVKKLLLNFFSQSTLSSSPVFGIKKQTYKSFINFFYHFFSVYEQLLPNTTSSSFGTLGMRSLGLSFDRRGNFRLYLILVVLFESFEIFKEVLLEKRKELLCILRLLSLKRIYQWMQRDQESIDEDIESERETAMLESVKRLVKKVDKLLQFLRLFNFLFFLHSGQGPSLLHNLAQLKMIPTSSSNGIPFISSQLFYESRKIIWYSTIALVSSLSMTIDFDYLKSSAHNLYKSSSSIIAQHLSFLLPYLKFNKQNDTEECEDEVTEKKMLKLTNLSCVKCLKTQIEMPQVLTPCSHIICYLCIPATSITYAKSFACPGCQKEIGSFCSWSLDEHYRESK